LFDGKLNLLEVDCRLQIKKLAKIWDHATQAGDKTYGYLRRLKDILRHATPSDILRDCILDLADKLFREIHSRLHQQEQQHSLVFVFRSSLPDAHAVLDLVRESGVEHIVYFCASEAHARRVQHAVCAPVEVDLLCCGIDGDEIWCGC
jgi:hypothetical protein